MPHARPRPAGALPRSLGLSVGTHALVLAAGLAWGALAADEGSPGRPVHTARFEPASAPALAEQPPERAPEAPPVDEHEPHLRESELWAEPVPPGELRGDRIEPVAPRRASDWLSGPPALREPTLEPRLVERAQPAPVRHVYTVAPRAAPLVREPVLLEGPPPAYPRLARRAGEEGSVLCRLHLDAAGRVTGVEVVESSGSTRLDEAARAALAAWRFEPRREDGSAVTSSLLHRVIFRLDQG